MQGGGAGRKKRCREEEKVQGGIAEKRCRGRCREEEEMQVGEEEWHLYESGESPVPVVGLCLGEGHHRRSAQVALRLVLHHALAGEYTDSRRGQK